MENFLSYFAEYFNMAIFLICFCVGFAIKNAKAFKNIDNIGIPVVIVVLAIILGIVNSLLTHNTISVDYIATCVFSGLLSTSCYELYKSLTYYVQRTILNKIDATPADIDDATIDVQSTKTDKK